MGTAPTRLLVVNTGGTLGMVLEDGCLTVERGALEREMPACLGVEDPNAHSPFVWNSGDGHSVEYDIIEMDPIVDSSDMGTGHVLALARILSARHAECDAFLIIHGTDTMAYTAAALSFLIESPEKPVFLTGSMTPIWAADGEAAANILGIFRHATKQELRGVYVYFHGKLIPGTHCTKVHSENPDAFACTGMVSGVSTTGLTRFYTKLADGIFLLKLTPYLRRKDVERLLAGQRYVVLESYGMGNVPAWLAELITMHPGVLFVNVTQCVFGPVRPAYRAGNVLSGLSNVLSGRGMSTETAMAKLSFLLGNFGVRDLPRLFGENLRGEMGIIHKNKL